MKVIRIFTVLLVLTVTSFACVSLFYSHLLKNLPHMETALKAVVSEKNESNALETDKGTSPEGYGIIVKRNIFQSLVGGEPLSADTASEDSIEKTTLQLELLGTVFSQENPEERAIIIDGKTGKQELYRLGDKLQGSVIKKILRGKVILEVHGKTEALLLKERKGGGPGPPAVEMSAENSSDSDNADSPQEGKRNTVNRPRRRIPLQQSEFAGSSNLSETVEAGFPEETDSEKDVPLESGGREK